MRTSRSSNSGKELGKEVFGDIGFLGFRFAFPLQPCTRTSQVATAHHRPLLRSSLLDDGDDFVDRRPKVFQCPLVCELCRLGKVQLK